MRGRNDRFRPIGSVTDTGQGTSPVAIYVPEGTREVGVVATGRSLVRLGNEYTPPAVTSTNGITTIATAGTPTGGTFTLTAFPGTAYAETTSALTHNESAADVETALLALGCFAVGDTTDAGGALPTAITITWGGVYAGRVPPLIGTASFTGGSNPSLRVYTSTQPDANGGYGYVEADTPTIFTRERDSIGAFDRYVHIAAVAATVNYFITFYG